MKVMTLCIMVLGTASAAVALPYEYEAGRTNMGAQFSEHKVTGKLSSDPVQINDSFKAAETAEYTAEARNYAKPFSKMPPVLKNGTAAPEKRDNHTAETVGACVGGAIGTFAGTMYGMATALSFGSLATSTIVCLAPPVAVGVVAGVAIGYGVVAGSKWLYSRITR